MKRLIKIWLNRVLSPFGYGLVRLDTQKVFNKKEESFQNCGAYKAIFRSLFLQYQDLVMQGKTLPRLTDVGFRIFSQTDEDGIILFLFSIIGTTNKIFVEIGCGDGKECNCANLAINFGWHGLFIDGNPKAIASGKIFYERHPDTRILPPIFLPAKVTRENINHLISKAGFSGEIDFLSIDIDGMDYWIWEAVESVAPRVVVVEANGKFGMRSITVPYDANWIYEPEAKPHYHGASLPAMTKLATRKGYRLIGTNRFGYNAFYVRNDIGQRLIPTVTVESCRTHPTRKNDEEIFAKIRHLPYVEV